MLFSHWQHWPVHFVGQMDSSGVSGWDSGFRTLDAEIWTLKRLQL